MLDLSFSTLFSAVLINIIFICFLACGDHLKADEETDTDTIGWYEKDYQEVFTDYIGGEKEVVLSDRSRVDVMTNKYAIEVDFAKSGKAFEAVGQALYYSIMTDKKAGIVLIRIDRNSDKYIGRIKKVCIKHKIALWIIDSELQIAKIN